uniref:Glycosyltransferase 2-like domain-containing protein n=1 Tax=Chromera velia CCMP2878 TaxID=1169474 RepID=A0A0G4HMW4_9ALVE|eukprot:Cvel_7614.t1-p1 / transcript=Cvel_7614.t1 / gene=Cvel_7614 / organism=Chromera_velia_CCMP2878 / gene_product=Beta-1,4-mannosyltransferase egh, putative / transcript_product=Beta-1,4-mannosyltransferase egh, putative / location=Cvel_scaffold401:83571-89435(-) / protein_length=545 / sequence_SO=supercontig / SO=protein_coding / is_pseudo=false
MKMGFVEAISDATSLVLAIPIFTGLALGTTLICVGILNPIGVVNLGGRNEKFSWEKVLEVFRLPYDEENPDSATHRHLHIRVVTKGTNPHLTSHSTSHNLRILRSFVDDGLLFHPRVEIVTDNRLSFVEDMQGEAAQAGALLSQIVVPPEYETAGKSKFKARALQYAIQWTNGVLAENPTPTITDNDVIVHLDEETKLTEEVVQGILEYYSEGGNEGFHKIGQGVIAYGHDTPLVCLPTTIADSWRVIDDYARMRLFFTVFRAPLQGMKGSFVCTSAKCEREISFDVGPAGSITEDACFALMGVEKGVRFGFVRGLMWERSPFSWGDFLKQRRRWLQGLWKVAGYKSKLKCRSRILLLLTLTVTVGYAFVTWAKTASGFHVVKKEFGAIAAAPQEAEQNRLSDRCVCEVEEAEDDVTAASEYEDAQSNRGSASSQSKGETTTSFRTQQCGKCRGFTQQSSLHKDGGVLSSPEHQRGLACRGGKSEHVTNRSKSCWNSWASTSTAGFSSLPSGDQLTRSQNGKMLRESLLPLERGEKTNLLRDLQA